MLLLWDDIEEELFWCFDNRLFIEKVKVNVLLDELFKNVVEFDSMVFVVIIFFVEFIVIFCVIGDMICKEFEGFVFLEFNCIMVVEFMLLVFDEEVLFWFLDNELFVNKVNVSGLVNLVIESDEVFNIECIFFVVFWVMGFEVVMNDIVIVIGFVELMIVKLVDWRMVRMLVLLRSEVSVVVLVLLIEKRWLE